MYRTREPNIVDCISPLRISIYHHIIIKNQKNVEFLDIMDCILTPDYEIYLNDLNEKHPDHDFYFNEEDLVPTKRTSKWRKLTFRKNFIKRVLIFLYDKDRFKKIKENKIKTIEVNKKVKETIEEIKEIFTNRSYALIMSRDKLLAKVADYKTSIMKGEDLPIYYMRVSGKRIRKCDIYHGEDILKNKKITKKFKKFMSNNL